MLREYAAGGGATAPEEPQQPEAVQPAETAEAVETPEEPQARDAEALEAPHFRPRVAGPVGVEVDGLRVGRLATLRAIAATAPDEQDGGGKGQQRGRPRTSEEGHRPIMPEGGHPSGGVVRAVPRPRRLAIVVASAAQPKYMDASRPHSTHPRGVAVARWTTQYGHAPAPCDAYTLRTPDIEEPRPRDTRACCST